MISLLVLTSAESATHSLPASLNSQDENADWELYTSSGEEFSVLMPEPPGVIQTSDCLDLLCLGKRVETTYAAYSNGVVYVVTSFKAPTRPSLEEIISEKMSPAVISSDSTVTSNVKLNKFRGKNYIYQVENSDYDILTTFYLADEHVYQVTATGGSRNDPEILRFFESFSLGSGNGIEIGEGARRGGTTLSSAPPKIAAQRSKDNRPSVNGAQLENVFKPQDVLRKAIIVIKPIPEYTEEARNNQIEGIVTLQMVFASTGRVTTIRTISGLKDGLTENAIRAALKIYFLPALKNGKRVSQYIRVEYHFNVY